VDHVYVRAVFHGRRVSHTLDRILVDTGATCTILPRGLADTIGVFATPFQVQLTLADRSRKAAAIGMVEVEIEGQQEPVSIAVMDDGVPALGVQGLEVLGFEVNPVTKKLEAVRESGGLALGVEDITLGL